MVVWGLVHLFAGIMTMSLDTAEAVAGIADGVDRASLTGLSYHAAAGALVDQHGWNLAWIGATTLIGGIFIWRRTMTAIWVMALVGGLTDLGYFIFIDLGGFANVFPGTVMTLISAAAILLSGWVWLGRPEQQG